MPPDVVEEVLVIILKITIIVCGSLVAGRLVLAKAVGGWSGPHPGWASMNMLFWGF